MNKDKRIACPLGLGKSELEVMQFVWRQEGAGKKTTAAKDAFTSFYTKRKLAYTTISTAFKRLAQKGWLAQVKEVDRAFHYQSTLSRREVGEQLMDWAVTEFFDEDLARNLFKEESRTVT